MAIVIRLLGDIFVRLCIMSKTGFIALNLFVTNLRNIILEGIFVKGIQYRG